MARVEFRTPALCRAGPYRANSTALRSTFTSPAREEAGNATNLLHEEKRLLVLSSCHWGSSLRKPELRKQSMLTGTWANFPLCGRGIKLLLESPFFIFEALQQSQEASCGCLLAKPSAHRGSFLYFHPQPREGTGLSFHFSSNAGRVVLSQHFKDCFLGCRDLAINILFLSPAFISTKS